MRVPRFLALTAELVDAAGHPDIKRVSMIDWPEVAMSPGAIKVEMADGSAIILRVVGTAKDGGDDYGTPKEIPFPDWQVPKDKVRFDALPSGAGTGQ